MKKLMNQQQKNRISMNEDFIFRAKKENATILQIPAIIANSLCFVSVIVILYNICGEKVALTPKC